MNISQTQDLLSWLWSKFPNGKTLSADDKRSTVVAYFDELWQYSLEDVIAAARKALSAQPHFVPSAPEIAHYCTKTIDYQKYLPREYAQLEKALADVESRINAFQFYQTDEAVLHEFNMHVCCYPGNLTPELQKERDELQAKRDAEFSKSEASFAENDRLRAACDVISNQMAEMMSQAYDKACRAYTDTQRKLAIPDLKKLGIPQSQLALEG
jgi:hypothetical protein